MNTRMWLHPATQEAAATLARRGVLIVPPESGWLAEREVGLGRLADPARIVAATLAAARRSTQLAGKKIVITAGPTREPLDPVRYLSNGSSGKMGYALATAAARRGAAVVLVSGPVDLPPPFGVRVIGVTTAHEMRSAVLVERAGAHAVFMVAAVSDYAPVASERKLKKTGVPLTLVLEEGPDILAELGRLKESELLVAFAAETDDVVGNAAKKLAAKNADFIVANDVTAPGLGIGSDRNAVTILDRSGGRWDVAEAGKPQIAEAILDRVLAGPAR
jgi:phosphopantothenoylcysteine decarboxylase/phosphopantothenate--cysteine ligase